MKHLKIGVMMLVAAFAVSPALFAHDPKPTKSNDQATLQKEAKITMDQAREIALKKAPGTIDSAELEREHGKLIYSFDIKTSKPGVTEVQVSAISGKIVSVKQETPSKEAAEKKKEAKENKH